MTFMGGSLRLLEGRENAFLLCPCSIGLEVGRQKKVVKTAA